MKLLLGDCREKMKELEANSIDTIITDPPYGLEFMGVAWDTFKDRKKGTPRTRNEWGDFGSREHARHPSERAKIQRKKGLAFYDFSLLWATEALRVAKPGAILMSFGGTRTFHRMTCAIEDAGWEIRDCMMWLYGSGFPKSHNLGKAVDRLQGNDREVLNVSENDRPHSQVKGGRAFDKAFNEGQEHETLMETKGNSQWEGWGTALKPAWEPIIVAMKPLEGTFAQNALKHGVAGLNIDGGRIGNTGATKRSHQASFQNEGIKGSVHSTRGYRSGHEVIELNKGRFPSNLILDKEAGEILDEQSGTLTSGKPQGIRNTEGGYGKKYGSIPVTGIGDSGGASRFFYCTKSSKAERNAGCGGLEEKKGGMVPERESAKLNRNGESPQYKNSHPTIKPVKLMEYLCTLTRTPTGGKVLDPFMGSGTTGVACVRTRREFIGIEISEEFLEIAKKRIEGSQKPLL